MKKELSANLLEKYFAGNCTELERAEINSWYSSFENSPDDVSVLPEKEQLLFKALMWENISRNINTAEDDDVIPLNPPKSSALKSVIYWLSGVAAMLLIGYVVKQKALPANTPLYNNESQVYNNITGTIQQITLSDGSKVWVSPKSSLTYQKTFEKHSRKVSLTGEAFFEVTKDHARPFSIYTGKVITKVWGTSFRIRAYQGDNTTKVDVVTGKVSVRLADAGETHLSAGKTASTDDNGVMLLPDQEAVYDKGANNLQKNTEIKDVSIGMWKRASLSFNNIPLKDVFKVLNKRFNVNISSKDDNINSDNLKADFTNENLATIMEILKRTLNVTYRVNGNEFVLEIIK
ncbi:FecR family protein [Mucilaginibacter sp. SP1R1]|uniref:FecR family protein n=1 Tax=Mucilaginibacter sp. SP1R1 TaxID=2723091 RepID=UPI0016173002|nr:FecR domain-containing protein [Mucilaginibacter sp. SP1R1]MBB6147678.1 ferric-dicitrate binding protein FerR (iron transport regulator) [Mucilaginibacter sp. SP1R1]